MLPTHTFPIAPTTRTHEVQTRVQALTLDVIRHTDGGGVR